MCYLFLKYVHIAFQQFYRSCLSVPLFLFFCYHGPYVSPPLHLSLAPVPVCRLCGSFWTLSILVLAVPAVRSGGRASHLSADGWSSSIHPSLCLLYFSHPLFINSLSFISTVCNNHHWFAFFSCVLCVCFYRLNVIFSKFDEVQRSGNMISSSGSGESACVCVVILVCCPPLCLFVFASLQHSNGHPWEKKCYVNNPVLAHVSVFVVFLHIEHSGKQRRRRRCTMDIRALVVALWGGVNWGQCCGFWGCLSHSVGWNSRVICGSRTLLWWAKRQPSSFSSHHHCIVVSSFCHTPVTFHLGVSAPVRQCFPCWVCEQIPVCVLKREGRQVAGQTGGRVDEFSPQDFGVHWRFPISICEAKDRAVCYA